MGSYSRGTEDNQMIILLLVIPCFFSLFVWRCFSMQRMQIDSMDITEITSLHDTQR